MLEPLNCQHKSHLFHNPLCETQSLAKRVANIVFHIVTLGIPFIVYHVITYCFKSHIVKVEDEQKGLPVIPEPGPIPLVNPDTLSSGSETTSTHIDHSLLIYEGAEVHEVNVSGSRDSFLELAHELLVKYADSPDIQWHKEFYNGFHMNSKGIEYGPNNKDINKLLGIMRGPLWDNLVQALQEVDDNNAWTQEAVLKAADILLQSCMAIFMMTIEDMEGLNHPDTGISLAQILQSGNYYQNRTVYYVWDIYTLLKSGVQWSKTRNALIYPQHDIVVRDNDGRFFNPYNILITPKSCPDGLCQTKWKNWFNTYCEQFTNYFKQDPSFSRHNIDMWMPQKDDSERVFKGKDSLLAKAINKATRIDKEARESELKRIWQSRL